MEKIPLTISLSADSLIYDGVNASIYHAQSPQYNQPIAAKVLKAEHPTAEQLQNFYNEYEISQRIGTQNIRKIIGKSQVNNRHALVLEYFEGITLKKYNASKTFTVQAFLQTVIDITAALDEIHSHHIIHKDINPNNVIITTDGKIVKIIDFGISACVDLRTQHLGNPEMLEGTLAYISPEQTGRMNRLVDTRSDLYSLGVTLYEMVAGVLPFEMKDPLELVHCHIAQIPASPSSLNKTIPPTLSAIIEKLLAKNAEDRYQSAFGLKQDLETCLQQWQQTGAISDFELAQHDFSGKFKLPQKLYGREKEIEQLTAAFKIAAQGAVKIALVGGYSGVGKSVLVNELHKPVTQYKGSFVSGKFDQLQRNIPYYAFIQAFKAFVELLLTERPEKLATWKQHILEAIGNVGKTLTDVIPNLELIIGEQPALKDLSPSENQNRFNYAMLSFINAISTAEHPLALFIDDMQWADAASLNLLKLIGESDSLKHILLLCAYRDNEVNATHPFVLTIADIKKSMPTVVVETIAVQNLTESNVQQLIADALNCTEARANELSLLVFAKTGGNAFFVGQFLQTLIGEGILTFNHVEKAWQWSMQAIQALNITDNVVELMTAKVKKLPMESQTIMQKASCIGNKFSLATIMAIAERTIEQMLTALNPAIEQGLIMPMGTAYQYAALEGVTDAKEIHFSFVHDRVQQAAYALIAENSRQSTHLKIGRSLLADTPATQLVDEIFSIVNQFNQANTLLTESTERAAVAELNLMAGRKAKSSNAYAAALNFLNIGAALLPQNKWEQLTDLSFKLYTDIAECAYLNADFDQSADAIKTLHLHAETKDKQVLVYEIEHELHKAQTNFPEALAVALKTLKLLGEPLPEKPHKGHIMLAFMKSKMAIGRRKADNLVELPLMTDKTKLSAMKMLSRTGLAAYLTNPDMLPLISLKTLQLSLKYGNTDQSPHAYAIYGFILNMMGDTKQAKAYSNMSFALLARINAPEMEGKLLMVRNGLLSHWHIPLKDTIPVFVKALQIGREVGDLETIFTATLMHFDHCLFAGSTMAELAELATEYKKINIQNKQEQAIHAFTHYETYTNTLLGTDIDALKVLAKKDTSEGFLKNSDKVGLSKTQLHLAMACYVCGLHEQALKNIAIAGQYTEAIMGLAYQWAFSYYEALVCIENYRHTKNPKLLAKANKNLKNLKKWSKEQPETFAPKVALVQAELYSVANKAVEAVAFYEEAISLTHKNGFLVDEAIANELMAKYYFNARQEKVGMMYLVDAHYVYKNWGATLKVKQLENQYPQLLQKNRNAGAVGASQTINSSTTSVSESLDLATVMKAATAISREIVLEKLLEKLVRLSIENAGAEKGCLMLETKGEFRIEAVGTSTNSTVSILESLAIKDSPYVSEAIVNYVLRTRETIVLANACEDAVFGKDAGIKAYGLKSAMCMPIINQGKLVGAMYLENNLTTGTFTQDRIEMLRLLSGQATVSIDNALLYRNLEQKVEERTQEIRHQKEIIEEKSKEIHDSITYARRIQRAMLPTEEHVKQRIDNSFILFKPKDVVSGDFYAFAEKDDCYVLVAADCTGHGVPGAFMSMVGHNAFTDIVEDRNITQPSLILEELNKAVRRALKQDETQTKDGMDAAIVNISKGSATIQYAGANRPLWIIKNTENKEVEEVKATKTAVGGHTPADQVFENHVLSLQKGDSIYMSSDGYADQFGGPLGKKLMTKRFKEILVDMQHLSMNEQEGLVNTEFETWKGDLEQIDDVCVIGVRL